MVVPFGAWTTDRVTLQPANRPQALSSNCGKRQGSGRCAIGGSDHLHFLPSGWKDDLLFTVLGFLLACGLIWLLEEIRDYSQQKS